MKEKMNQPTTNNVDNKNSKDKIPTVEVASYDEVVGNEKPNQTAVSTESKGSKKKLIIGVVALMGCLSIIIISLILAGTVFMSINPTARVNDSKEVALENLSIDLLNATNVYKIDYGEYPWASLPPALQPQIVGKEAKPIKDAVWVDKLIQSGTLKKEITDKDGFEDLVVWQYLDRTDPTKKLVKVCFKPVTSECKKKADTTSKGIPATENAVYCCVSR